MKQLLLSLCLGVCCSTSFAQIFREDFEYTAGSLAGNGNWIVNSKYPTGEPIAVTGTGLTKDQYSSKGGAALIKPGNIPGAGAIVSFGSDQLNLAGSASSGAIYWSFLVRFNEAPTNANGSYFIYLGEDGGDGRGRVYVKPDPALNGKFSFGAVAGNNPALGAFTPYNYEKGKVYLVVQKFEKGATADKVSLWIYDENTVPGLTEPVPTVESDPSLETSSRKAVSGVGFRTFENSYDITIDALRADVVWNNVITLPIKLSSFSADKQSSGVTLSWSTASERNNSHFNILRYGDNAQPQVIATVAGRGTSDANSTYSFTDHNPLAGINYYQLEQVDFDGRSEKFPPLAVRIGLKDTEFNLFASVGGVVKATVSSPFSGNAVLYISNMSGSLLTEKAVILQNGFNELQMNLRVQPGVYVGKLVGNTGTVSKKFIVN